MRIIQEVVQIELGDIECEFNEHYKTNLEIELDSRYGWGCYAFFNKEEILLYIKEEIESGDLLPIEDWEELDIQTTLAFLIKDGVLPLQNYLIEISY